MKKKSSHSPEQDRFTRLLIGFCYASGITLATFTYGKNVEIKPKERFGLELNEFYITMEEPKEVKQPPKAQSQKPKTQEKPKPILTQEIKPVKDEVKPIEDEVEVETDSGTEESDTTTTITTNTSIIGLGSDEVSDFPDVEAKFEGGYDAWKDFLLNELDYPEISIEYNEQGTVYLSFVIELDGSIGEVRVLRGVSRLLDQEAIRVIKKSPKWSPGMVNGRPVRTRINVPINFVLQ
jgi:protein TonB